MTFYNSTKCEDCDKPAMGAVGYDGGVRGYYCREHVAKHLAVRLLVRGGSVVLLSLGGDFKHLTLYHEWYVRSYILGDYSVSFIEESDDKRHDAAVEDAVEDILERKGIQ